tara:strand:- start:228 stop:641 length:414 start_codon:yes stop_codon:yes gene_type:complete
MASAHGVNFVQDLIISSTSTGLYDINGDPLATADITSNSYAYSKAVELSPKSIEHILYAICEDCTLDVLLQMSPDGKNWIDCKLAGGTACEFTCTGTVGDCTTQVIDTSLLSTVRVKIGNAGSSGGKCTIGLNFTLN